MLKVDGVDEHTHTHTPQVDLWCKEEGTSQCHDVNIMINGRKRER